MYLYGLLKFPRHLQTRMNGIFLIKFSVYDLYDNLVATKEYKGARNAGGKQQSLFKEICNDFFDEFDKIIRKTKKEK